MGEWQETEIGRIPKHWGLDTLEGISSLITDGAHKSPKHEATNFLMPSVKDMTYDKFDFTNCKTISEQDFHELVRNNCSPHEGDIIISKDGANCLDLIFVYYQKEKVVLLSSLAIVRLKEEYSPDFFRFYMLSPNAQFLMRNNLVSGSAIPRVVLKDFKKVQVPIPAFEEQRAIASVLSSLDAKIDLLYRQNKTLEAMAETLFRQWFVVEAEEGWKEGTLSDVMEIFDSKRIPLSNLERATKKTGKLYPYYGAASIMDEVNEYLFDGEYILLGEDGTVITDKGYPVLQYATGKFWVNNHAHVLQGKASFSNRMLWCLLKTTNVVDIVTGAVQPKINQGNLKAMDVTIPPPEVAVRISNAIDPLFDKVNVNNTQIASLTTLRDTLLPKLMSGEVRVQLP